MADAGEDRSLGVPSSIEFSADLRRMTRDELVVYYSLLNYSCKDIRNLLVFVHGHTISLRHLWTLRKKFGVHTRNNESPLSEIIMAMRSELNKSGSMLGYRLMWVRLRTMYCLNVRRDTVMMLLHLLDSDGSNLRKAKKLRRRHYWSKGPNFIWHVDGYDKLKPYGITIHGCIDGFSRRVMWLRVANTNNDPRVIAKHFTDCVRTVKGCPTVVRCDRGTENVNISAIQPTFRHNHEDSFAKGHSFMYGRSTANQRIEAFWSHLRRSCTHWWIQFFKVWIFNHVVIGSLPWNEEAIRFCFAPLIQKEVDDIAYEWNHHRIRQYNLSEVPSGIPEILYHLPETAGGIDCKQTVEDELIDDAERYYTSNYRFTTEEFAMYGQDVLHEEQNSPQNWSDALQHYFLLLNDMSNYT